MCGIVGLIGGPFARDREHPAGIVERMADSLEHRGPDDRGSWIDPDGRVALGHRRLAIIDLSADGHQPMASADGRWITSFNGEIYNFRELRGKLEAAGTRFRGGSDTEVLLALVAREGPAAALAATRGMFAVAFWDTHAKVLYLARDRLGEKPLYYGHLGETFVFASELRALFQHPDWRGELDRDALLSLLRYNCIPAPQSVFRGIAKLGPGELLTQPLDGEPRITQYWDPSQVMSEARNNLWSGTPEALLDELGHLLGSVVADQMVADVPLGAFLSGGVDSSLIVALMQAQASRPVRTFTIGFGAQEFNEAVHAREVARILGTDHVEHYMSGQDALDRVPGLPACYDEPFADSSQLPTMLVSEVARRHVTVSLSGDGGDELFGGYTRYPDTLASWERLRHVPMGLRNSASRLVEGTPDAWLGAAGRLMQAIRPRPIPAAGLADRIRDRARRWAAPELPAVYRRAMSFWDRPEDVVVGGKDTFERERVLAAMALTTEDPATWMRFRDAMIYLPDDILVKVDRAAMRVSLETRVPLLDHRVVELAWRVPTGTCFLDGRGKWPLRALLGRHLPESLIDRPKMGFAVPLNDWLRGPLRDWAEDLLDPARLAREGWFHPEPVRRRWDDLLAGGDGHELPLWSILMFQAWKAHWGSAIAS